MKKYSLLFAALFFINLSCSKPDITPPENEKQKWKIVYEDNFDGSSLSSKWSNCTRMTSDWNKYIENNSQTLEVKDGYLYLRAIKNTDNTLNAVPYLTSGVKTQRQVNIKYGKVEVRAKFKHGQGSWPAIWMMPEDQSQAWPACGEIDIMEHISNQDKVFQTVHSHYVDVLKIKDNPAYYKTVPFGINQFNTYGIEWYADKIDFTLNGRNITFTYPRINADGQWPFDKSFYLILNQAAGGAWPGAVKDSDLPFEMQVDWVKFYQLQ